MGDIFVKTKKQSSIKSNQLNQCFVFCVLSISTWIRGWCCLRGDWRWCDWCAGWRGRFGSDGGGVTGHFEVAGGEAVHLASGLVHPDVDAVLWAAVSLCLASVLLGKVVGYATHHLLYAAAAHPHHVTWDTGGGNPENGNKQYGSVLHSVCCSCPEEKATDMKIGTKYQCKRMTRTSVSIWIACSPCITRQLNSSSKAFCERTTHCCFISKALKNKNSRQTFIQKQILKLL